MMMNGKQLCRPPWSSSPAGALIPPSPTSKPPPKSLPSSRHVLLDLQPRNRHIHEITSREKPPWSDVATSDRPASAARRRQSRNIRQQGCRQRFHGVVQERVSIRNETPLQFAFFRARLIRSNACDAVSDIGIVGTKSWLPRRRICQGVWAIRIRPACMICMVLFTI